MLAERSGVVTASVKAQLGMQSKVEALLSPILAPPREQELSHSRWAGPLFAYCGLASAHASPKHLILLFHQELCYLLGAPTFWVWTPLKTCLAILTKMTFPHVRPTIDSRPLPKKVYEVATSASTLSRSTNGSNRTLTFVVRRFNSRNQALKSTDMIIDPKPSVFFRTRQV